MKKNSGFVPKDLILEEWLMKKILEDPPKSVYADELLAGIQDMLNGEVTSLLLSGAEDININHITSIDDVIKVEELEIYPRSRRVIVKGKEVNLTPKEFDILYFLVTNRGEVFTKEQIYKAVWANDYLLDDSNIMAFIRKLRKKIEPSPDEPKYILTIWGIGYKFNDQL